MRPVKLQDATRHAVPPENWDYSDGPVDSLSICDYQTKNGNVMVTAWLPTEEELSRLVNGSVLFIHQYGMEPVPLKLSIQRIQVESEPVG